MDFENIAVRCETHDERLRAIQILEKIFDCGHTSYSESVSDLIKYVYFEKRPYSGIKGQVFGLKDKIVKEGKILDDYGRRELTVVPFSYLLAGKLGDEYYNNLKIAIRFNSFHSASVSRKGIKFPWRENMFPLEIVRDLIKARKLCT